MRREAKQGRAALVIRAMSIALLAGGCTFVSVQSHAPDDSDGNGASGRPALDNSGKYMTFQSDAANLVPGDANGVTDVFKADALNRHVERPSVATDGTEGNGPSRNPDMDCCGGHIVFESDASNLVAADTNSRTDVFEHSQITKATLLVSAANNGGPADGDSTHPTISSDGKWIAFESTATNIVPGVSGHQVYVRPWGSNGPTGPAHLVSAASCVSGTPTGGNGDSTRPRIGADGTIIAFTSTSTDFATNPNNSSPNAYAAPTTGCGAPAVPSLVGYDTSGNIPPHGTVATSTDRKGRFVAFNSYAAACPSPCTIGGVFVRDRTTNTSVAIAPGDSAAAGGSLNDGGSTIAIQATGPGGIAPVAAVVTVSTGAFRVVSTDPAGNPRTVVPIVDPATDGPNIAPFTAYFAYTAAGGSNPAQVFLQTAQPQPVVSGVSPGSVARGASNVVLTISGTGFAAGAKVVPPPGVTVDTTTVVNTTTIQVKVHVDANAPTGAGGVSVGVPGGLGLYYGSLGGCSGCLNIT
jgi:hypothetical protein